MIHHTREPEHIESLIKFIKPGLRKLNLKLDRNALLRAAVKANVRWSMQQLLAFPKAKRAIKEERVTHLEPFMN